MSMSFGESLRRLRMEKGLSQQRLSEILFVDRSTIVRWETGSRTPDVLLLSRIADALGVDVRLLLDAAAESAPEKPNVILVDDERIILSGSLPVLFRVPPLTLQPIVENAVKHGVDPELEPLYISIRAYETPEGSEITVEDSGPGFGPADDREPHIALENIRRRLELQCRGTLRIAPRPGGGTAVTITVPNKT